MAAWIVSLFLFLTISIDVYCPVTLELKSLAMRIPYTLMFAVIGERPELQGWALKAPSSRGGPSVDGETFVFCFANLLCVRQTLNQAASGTRRPNIIGRV